MVGRIPALPVESPTRAAVAGHGVLGRSMMILSGLHRAGIREKWMSLGGT
jgi:hypothetical protein